ncbi:MAG TPA: hypothetical protein DCL77_14555 [Prolixibacteraceae bacterium]|jgi:hypothetical protein|nr:hypothetical protein [Prolixibacteraceae bacterium]
MLTLTLNGNVIPLPKGFSTELTWKSPVTNFEKIPSGYALGISFSINEYTRMLFGNPERFTKRRLGSKVIFPGFEIRIDGVLNMSGTLTITNTSNDTYECSLADQVGVLGEKEQLKYILDVEKFAVAIPWQNRESYLPADVPYCCFPVQNSNFFDGKGMVVERTERVPDPDHAGKNKDATYDTEIIKYCFRKENGSLINAREAGETSLNGPIKANPTTIDLSQVTPQSGNTYEAGRAMVVTPYFFLNYIIEESLRANDFHCIENCISDDAVLKKLCIYNNYDITRMLFDLTGTVYTEESVPRYGVDPATGDLGVYYETKSIGTEVYSYNRDYDGNVWIKNHLPKMSLGDLLIGVQNLFNVVFHFLPNKTYRIISRETVMAQDSIDLDRYFIGTWSIGEKKCVALKFSREHDGNDLVFSSGYKDLSDRRKDIKAPVPNFTLLTIVADPKEGDIRYVTEVGSFYEYKWITQTKLNENNKDNSKDVLGWAVVSIGYQDGWYEFGREEFEEIKTLWSSCWGVSLGEGIRRAIVQQPGNMNAWRAEQQAFSPRLMIYQEGAYGAHETDDLSFEYEKPVTGILPKYWKRWNPFWANRLPVSGEFDLPVNVLRHVIYNICRKFRTNDGEFLIEEMKCVVYEDRIGRTQVDGFKVE